MTAGSPREWYVVCFVRAEFTEITIYKVIVAWVADTVHQILICHARMCSAPFIMHLEAKGYAVYTQLITDFANPLKLLAVPMCVATLYVIFEVLIPRQIAAGEIVMFTNYGDSSKFRQVIYSLHRSGGDRGTSILCIPHLDVYVGDFTRWQWFNSWSITQ
jgi:hypothetical protein